MFQLIRRRASAWLALLALFPSFEVRSQPAQRGREFRPGEITRIDDLPPSRLRSRLEALPLPAQQRALEVLRRFHFPEADLNSLNSNPEGDLYYEDHFPAAPAQAQILSEPLIAQSAVPVSPFPPALHFHSNPGASAVLYLNFGGDTVTGTAWNSSVGRTEILAVPFSFDSDYSTFSDTEQTAIRCIWQRVTEDFAPFEIDVTTERPATFGPRTAHALITRNTDSSNNANPSSASGGVAFVNVFGQANYGNYRPAWIYANNLGASDSSIAEAISHEIGHNLGLSHDGEIDGTEYYSGHGSGLTSWGPIMGACYNRNITQWSKGEYFQANNSQDDLAIIAQKIPYRSDEIGDMGGEARMLIVTGTTNVTCTLENDPDNTDPDNKGVLQHEADSDSFIFATGDGPIRLQVNPWTSSSGTGGGNLDILAELWDENGTLLLTNNSTSEAVAQIQMNLTQGTYYLRIRNSGAGDPFNALPTGYTSYGSVGQYFITGFIAPPTTAAGPVQLTATANNPAWGTVTPTAGTYSVGAMVQLSATPSPWYRFTGWTNGISSTANPLTLIMTTNLSVVANFAEVMTTLHPTPYWWLAAQGYMENPEAAAETLGRNGLPLWQSYVAGLNPNDPDSQLRVNVTRSATAPADVLNWNPVTGRVYTIWAAANLSEVFAPLPGASNLPATLSSFTNAVSPAQMSAFYRLEVRKP